MFFDYQCSNIVDFARCNPTQIKANKEIFHEIFRLSSPIVLSSVFQFLINFINIAFIGHLQPSTYLGAGALAFMFINVTGFAPISGLSTALDTLCSQAYGARQYHLVGTFAQRAAALLFLATFPIAICWSYCTQILLVLQQDREISELAGRFVLRLIPGFFAAVQYQVIMKYLQTQKIMSVFVFVGLGANIVHAFCCYFYIHFLEWGFEGAAWAHTTVQYFNLIAVLIAIQWKGYHKQTWPGWLLCAAFKGWRELVVLGIPGLFLVSLEWWAFEILAIPAGLLGKLELSSYVVLMNINALVFMIPFGIANASSTIIGNYLGSGFPQEAKATAKCALLLVSGSLSLLAASVLASRSVIGWTFSGDEQVVEMVAHTIPFLALMELVDGLQGCCSGVLRGLGLQKIGAVANLAGYYLVGLPLAWVLSFLTSLRIDGLWLGLTIGVFTAFLLDFFIISTLDWDKQSQAAVERASQSQRHYSMLEEDEPRPNRREREMTIEVSSPTLTFTGA